MEGENIVIDGVTEYSDRKVIILPRYSIPRLPLSNAVVVCYGRVHCRIQSWIPGSVLFRLTDSFDLPLRSQGFRGGSTFLATSGRIYLFDYALITMITPLLSSPKPQRAPGGPLSVRRNSTLPGIQD